jgi:quercetin dioxygenase-like cupin family protein
VTRGEGTQRPYQVQHISLVVAGPGFQVREFTVAPGEEVPWHYHTEVTDWCYCLEGVVTAQTRDRTRPDAVTTIRLTPGQSCRIEPGMAHRLANGEDAPCRYLLVQAGGQHDFNKVDAGAGPE